MPSEATTIIGAAGTGFADAAEKHTDASGRLLDDDSPRRGKTYRAAVGVSGHDPLAIHSNHQSAALRYAVFGGETDSGPVPRGRYL